MVEKIFDAYGVNKTTNFQLIKWGNEMGIPNFHVVMRDEIQNIQGENVNFICNLHHSKLKGVHWSCVHSNNGKVVYFDSYGLPPTKEVEVLFEGSEIDHNVFEIQKADKSYCGQLCLFVLKELCDGKRFDDICVELYVLKNNVL